MFFRGKGCIFFFFFCGGCKTSRLEMWTLQQESLTFLFAMIGHQLWKQKSSHHVVWFNRSPREQSNFFHARGMAPIPTHVLFALRAFGFLGRCISENWHARSLQKDQRWAHNSCAETEEQTCCSPSWDASLIGAAAYI